MCDAKISGPAELSILLTNDAAQRELNLKWREKDTSTNVLSFPAIDSFAPISGMIGDISLARETLEREANDLVKSFDHHFTHLIVHGFLHCLGHDHEKEHDALVMEGLETQILAILEVDDPYAQN